MSATPLRLSRRQALGLAAGGAAGAAGLRLLTVKLGAAPLALSGGSGASAAGPAGAWASPLSSGRALAAHLLRRAGLGHSDAELDAAAAMPYADLVDALVNQRPDALPAPTSPSEYRSVVLAWYRHMATTAAPFPERMTLFWHGVLTSDYRKANRRPFVLIQNRTWRETGVTDLRSLLVAATYDPLMTEYLDLARSSGASPNENYSRELMELFTLGPGAYTEQDVREGARALSGIRMAALDASGVPVALPRPAGRTPQARQKYEEEITAMVARGVTLRGRLVPRLHDGGTKTYLGRTGDLGPEDVVDAILAKPEAAQFIARRAITAFAVPQPGDAYVTRIADGFRASRYDIRALMRSIFLSDEFRAADAYRALVRPPADYMVAAMRALGQPDLATLATAAGQAMDQALYDPPTVAGWPVNGAWISSSALLARLNFAQSVVGHAGHLPDPVTAVRNQLDGVVGPDTARVFDASGSDGDRWYALLASPEFQLK